MSDFYFNHIAEDYYNKRKKPWRPLISFMEDLKNEGFSFTGVSVDLGCAHGRHFDLFLNPQTKLIGIEKSFEFLQIARQFITDTLEFTSEQKKQLFLVHADFRFIPLRPNCIDNVFSIASLHHIKGQNHRDEHVMQIYQILKKNGLFIVTVWRKWQKKFRKKILKRLFLKIIFWGGINKNPRLPESGDVMVPWTLSSKNITIKRFYHLFTKRELVKLLWKFTIHVVEKSGGKSNKDNFFALVQKN